LAEVIYRAHCLTAWYS